MPVQREIDEAVEAAGPGPFRQRVGVAGRHGVFVLAPAGAGQLPVLGIGGAGDLGAGGAVEGGQKLERAAQFAGGCCGKVGVMDQRADHLGDLVGGVMGGEEHARQIVNQRRIGGVGQKAAGQFGADMARGGGVAGKQVQHLLAIRHGRAVGRKLDPQHALLVGIVPCLDIVKAPGFRRVIAVVHIAPVANRPAGKGAGDLVDVKVEIALRQTFADPRHVMPGVIAVVEIGGGTQSVEFQQFAGVILVGGRGAAVGVVEIVKHGGRAGDRTQQLAEIAEGMVAHQGVVRGEEGGGELVLERVDVEMVVPELGHDLTQLGGRMDGADQGGGDHLLRRAHTLGEIHAKVPVDQARQVGRVGAKGCQRAQVVKGVPMVAAFVAAGGIGDLQAGSAQAAGKVGVGGGAGQLILQPAGRAKFGKAGAVACGGPKGQAVQPQLRRRRPCRPSRPGQAKAAGRKAADQVDVELAATKHGTLKTPRPRNPTTGAASGKGGVRQRAESRQTVGRGAPLTAAPLWAEPLGLRGGEGRWIWGWRAKSSS